MRRRRTSSRPAAASKYHLPPCWTIGIGHRPVVRSDREHGPGLGRVELQALLLRAPGPRTRWRSGGPAPCPHSRPGPRRRRPGSLSGPARRTSPPPRPAPLTRSPGVAKTGAAWCPPGAPSRPTCEADRSLVSPHPVSRPSTPAAAPKRARSAMWSSSSTTALLLRRLDYRRRCARPCCSRRGSCWPARCEPL